MLSQEEYDAKRQARYERLLARAEKANKEAEVTWKRADDMASVIPFGQPILVGHYSEKGDRNFRDRIDNKRRQGYNLYKQAEVLRERAAAAEKNDAIYADDPSAIDKLETKLARLISWQEHMKLANKCLRMKDQNAGDAALLEAGFTSTQIAALRVPNVFGDIGFERFQLSNNNANIRRIKERIELLKKRRAQSDEELEINGVRIVAKPGDNRVQIIFKARVPRDVYEKLRRYGFRVSPKQAGPFGFQAYYNAHTVHMAKVIAMEYQGE